MKTTREITLKDRVFTTPDLMRFAGILDRQASDAPDSQVTTKYTVVFEDGHTVEGLASEVFSEEELNRPSRPIKVEMYLDRRGKPDYIRVSLRAGDDSWVYENSVKICGEDANWVNANNTALLDALGKVPPQSFWWKRHRILLLNLIALGVGNIAVCIIGITTEITFRIWPSTIGSRPAPSPGSALWAFDLLVK